MIIDYTSFDKQNKNHISEIRYTKMPKKSGKSSYSGRGGGRRVVNVESQEKHFFGHDDRTMRDIPTKITKTIGGNQLWRRPRVSFKNQTNFRRKDTRCNLEVAVNSVLDNDFPMSTGTNNNSREVTIHTARGRGTLRGRNSPLSHRGGLRTRNRELKRSTVGDTVWYSTKTQSYKVTILFGHRYERSFVVNSLLSYISPDTFVPIMYQINETSAIFYVDDQKTANKLKNCDRKITASDGFKLGVRVDPGFPQYNIDQIMRDKMKQAMVKRYVQETNALDLSRFHHDPELVDDYYCALSRPSILIAALDIVAVAIPNLEALNLDNNQLHSFDKLTLMKEKLSCVKILYLGDNKIRDLNQLNPIKELPLEELRLAGNPVCEKFKTRNDAYVSDIRNKFPKLLRLDGVELPRPISFDVEDDDTKLPPSQRMFVANPKAQEIASQFLQQYFIIFDSDNRQPLLNAYHEQACFSLTLSHAYSSNKFNSYHGDNRNLKRVVDVARRKKLLKLGRLPVVSFIAELPRTQHDLTSFTMDICLVTEGMMVITVSGLFKEPDTKDEPLRYFNRTFIIVPEGSGYCIQNEQLHLTQPTHMQEKKALQSPRIPAQVTTDVAGPATPSTSAAPAVSDEVRQQMTLTLSQHTNMNLEWSFKCLKEVDWHFDTALAAFHEFFKLGRIPPEAFKK